MRNRVEYLRRVAEFWRRQVLAYEMSADSVSAHMCKTLWAEADIAVSLELGKETN